MINSRLKVGGFLTFGGFLIEAIADDRFHQDIKVEHDRIVNGWIEKLQNKLIPFKVYGERLVDFGDSKQIRSSIFFAAPGKMKGEVMDAINSIKAPYYKKTKVRLSINDIHMIAK